MDYPSRIDSAAASSNMEVIVSNSFTWEYCGAIVNIPDALRSGNNLEVASESKIIDLSDQSRYPQH